jgi:uncharacterized protein
LVQFTEIPEDGLQVDVSGVSWFPDNELSRRGDPRASVFLERSGERVLAVGVIKVDLLLACDRCLAEFVSPCQVDFRLIMEVAETDESGAEPLHLDYAYSPGEIEVVTLDEPVVDIGDLLYQQVLLAVPQKILCRADCRGICGRCGADLNVEQCNCAESGASAFAALGQLLKDKK